MRQLELGGGGAEAAHTDYAPQGTTVNTGYVICPWDECYSSGSAFFFFFPFFFPSLSCCFNFQSTYLFIVYCAWGQCV